MTRLILASAFLLAASVAGAQELDEILGGFEDEPVIAAAVPTDPALADVFAGFDDEGSDAGAGAFKAEPDKPFRLSGVLSQRVVTNIGGQGAPHDGLTSLRSQLNLTADLSMPGNWRGRASGHAFYDGAFAVNGRGAYTPEFLDAYEAEVELGEAYVQGQLGPNVDLKLGRQIVVWGKSDAIRLTDILNPLDMRTPGLTDIRDLRLPVTMVRLDYFFGDWNLGAMAIPEVRFDKTPVPGSDFFPGTTALPADDFPGDGFGNTEYALALNGTFTGWDLSLYAASVFNDAPHGEMIGAGLRRRHARVRMAGVSANVGIGSWLLKGEAAVIDGLKFLGAPGDTFARVDILVGFDYSGLSWGTLTLEAANRHIVSFDPAIAGGPEDAREDEFELAFRVATSLMNDKLQLSSVVSILGVHGEGGGFQRFEANYEVSDRSKAIVGAVNYVSGDKLFFSDIDDNDRLYVKYEYRF